MQDEALKDDRTVAKADINHFTKPLKGVDSPDARQVHRRLLQASGTYLSTFESWLGS